MVKKDIKPLVISMWSYAILMGILEIASLYNMFIKFKNKIKCKIGQVDSLANKCNQW